MIDMNQALKTQSLAACWALVHEKRPTPDPHGLPAKTWAFMSLRTRQVLVMLGGTSDGDPRELARRPWEALTNEDRISIAACARQMGRELQNASCLF